MIYVYFFIKCVLRWSENSVRLKFLTHLKSFEGSMWHQMGQILWDLISQCEIWHVCLCCASALGVWLYRWSSVSIFMTPVDFVLLSPENTNLYVSSPQFGGNFEFNVIRKNPNGTVSITYVKCEHVMFRNLLCFTCIYLVSTTCVLWVENTSRAQC